ncbi:MAG: amidohydrolase family protein [Acidimicrobiales bacterium]
MKQAARRGWRAWHREGLPLRPAGTVVIEADWVLACHGDELRLLRDHSVVVEGDRIAQIRPGRLRGRERRVAAPGMLLVPGFISGHTHVAGGTTTRGTIEGGRSYARPLELVEELDDASLDAVTAHNLAELLRGGCTTQVEMSLSLRQAESYVRVAEAWCARGYPSAMVPGIGRLFDVWFRSDDSMLFDSVAASLDEIAAGLAFGRRSNGAGEGRILPQMGVHATDTQTPETMAAFAAAAAELGNGLHIHLSQSQAETDTVRRLWGKRPVEWLDDFAFADAPLFAAHMSGADLDEDPGLLRAMGGTYVHNPSGGGAGGSNQPWPEFLAAGVRTNVGIDTHSNDHLENIKLAVLYGQVRHDLLASSSPRPLARPTIWDAIRAATLDAAKGLGRSDLGRIEVGAKADLLTIDITGLLVGSGAAPPEPLNNLLYANGRCVRDVMVDGTFVVRNGHLVVADEANVVDAGGAVVAQLWDQLEAEGWFTD